MSGKVNTHSTEYNQGRVDEYVEGHKGKKGHENDEKDIKDFGSDDSDLPPADENDNAGDHTLIDKLPKGLQNLLKKMGIDTDAEFKHGKSEEGYGDDATGDTDGQGDKKPGGKNKGDKAAKDGDPEGRPVEGESLHYGKHGMGATVTLDKDGTDSSNFTVTPDGGADRKPVKFKNVPDDVNGTELEKNARATPDANGYTVTEMDPKATDPKEQKYLVRDGNDNTQEIKGPVVTSDAPDKPVEGTTYLNKNGTTLKKDGDTTTYTAQGKDGKAVTMNSKDPLLSGKSDKDAEAIVLAKAGKGPDGKPIAAVPEQDKDKRPADGATMKYQVSVGDEKRDIYVTADKDGKTMTFTDPKTGKQQTFDKTDKPEDFKADLVKFSTPTVTV
ncbi:hypothetical protein [Collimonas humicola]|uniref:hypothetical protein n=1 Tax=Collimonas humicola TaxID=2825886 RepID=UPI001B8A91B3|nr:hypothetical protein [Collimonas humicola]